MSTNATKRTLAETIEANSAPVETDLVAIAAEAKAKWDAAKRAVTNAHVNSISKAEDKARAFDLMMAEAEAREAYEAAKSRAEAFLDCGKYCKSRVLQVSFSNYQIVFRDGSKPIPVTLSPETRAQWIDDLKAGGNLPKKERPVLTAEQLAAKEERDRKYILRKAKEIAEMDAKRAEAEKATAAGK